MQIPLVDYYPWRSRSASTYAWDRSAGYEFMRHETKQLEQAYAWHSRIRSAHDEGDYEGINLYTVEIPKLRADWRAALAEDYGDHQLIGLSALMNGLYAPLMGILPAHAKRPDPYRLIRIQRARKVFLHRGKSVFVDPVVLVEEWEYRPSDEIYLDVPFERRHIAKLLAESMTGGDLALAEQLQAPLLSAPATSQRAGGIAVAAKEHHSAFAKEFHLTHQRLLPPEYSALRPPDSALKGRTVTEDGLPYHVAERPQPTRHRVDPLAHTDYTRFMRTLRSRGADFAEHSIVGTWLTHGGSDYPEENAGRLRQLFSDFGVSEITLADDLSDLVYADVDLTRMRRHLGDEDVMLSIVNARQFMPTFLSDAASPEGVLNDVRGILAGTAGDSEVEMRARTLAPAVHGHSRTIALSFARSEARPRATEHDEKRALRYVMKNLEELTRDPDIVRLHESAALELDAPFAAIKRALVANGPLDLIDLKNATTHTGLFRDATALQVALDQLRDRGYVYLDRKRRYVWIGE